jgi:hypothetical protein
MWICPGYACQYSHILLLHTVQHIVSVYRPSRSDDCWVITGIVLVAVILLHYSSHALQQDVIVLVDFVYSIILGLLLLEIPPEVEHIQGGWPAIVDAVFYLTEPPFMQAPMPLNLFVSAYPRHLKSPTVHRAQRGGKRLLLRPAAQASVRLKDPMRYKKQICKKRLMIRFFVVFLLEI